MRRSELKAIVKECLVEILQEGIGARAMGDNIPLNIIDDVRPRRRTKTKGRRSLQDAVMEGRQPPAPQSRRRGPSQNPGLDARVQQPNSAVVDAINEVAGDDMMAGIFADTASNTMQRQNAAGHFGPSRGGGGPSGGDEAGMVVATHEPEELFEGAEAWAALAFQDSAGPRGPVPSNPHAQAAMKSQPTNSRLDMPAHEAGVMAQSMPAAAAPPMHYDPYADVMAQPDLIIQRGG